MNTRAAVIIVLLVLACCCSSSHNAAPTLVLTKAADNNDGACDADRSFSGSEQKNCDELIWSGNIRDKVIVWQKDDIFVGSPNKQIPWFRPSFTKLHKALVRETNLNVKAISDLRVTPTEKTVSLHSAAGVQIVSVVGSIISFEIEYLSYLDGYPGHHRTWILPIDVAKNGIVQPFSADATDDVENVNVPIIADIRDIFPNSDILSALLANKDLKEGLLRSERGSVEQLRDLVEHKDLQEDLRIKVGSGGDVFTSYSFEHFAFDRIEGNSVIVQLVLAHYAIMSNYDNPFIEISLPIPPHLSSEFSLAAKNVNGFLRSNQNTITGPCGTSLELKTTIRKY